jgi:hypothetical protein
MARKTQKSAARKTKPVSRVEEPLVRIPDLTMPVRAESGVSERIAAVEKQLVALQKRVARLEAAR